MTTTTPTAEQMAEDDAMHHAVHAARRAEIAAMTPAQRFQLMHDLCAQITWLASARRVR